MLHVSKPGKLPAQGQPRITQWQFRRILESERGAHEACREFFKNSPLISDRLEIAEIASRAHRFASGRKSESNSQKFLVGMYLSLGGIVTAAAAVFSMPFLLFSWLPHTAMVLVISNLAVKTRDYASKTPPIFRAEGKIICETQRYLEFLEFEAYKKSLGKGAP